MDDIYQKIAAKQPGEAEQSVIGAMIMDRDAVADVIDIVNTDDFYQAERHFI